MIYNLQNSHQKGSHWRGITRRNNYRKISENVDNIKDSIDIASLLVKSQEVDSKIEANESNISSNLSDINDNKTNISSNLELIGEKSDIIEDNKLNISDNLSLINTTKTNVSSNLKIINTNKTNISDNLSLINTNKSNITENLKLINTNKSNITKKLKLINTNIITLSNIDLDLTNLRSQINTHQNDIQNLNEKVYNLSDCYKLKDIIIIDVEKTNIEWTLILIILNSLSHNLV